MRYNLLVKPLLLFISICLYPVSITAQQTNVWVENNGIVVIEAENNDVNFPTPGGWVFGNSGALTGFTGTGYIRFNTTGLVGGHWELIPWLDEDRKRVLTYWVKIETPGTYVVKLRNFHYLMDGDNDVFVSVHRRNFVKVYDHNTSQWTWDENSHGYMSTSFSTPGIYRIELSGRSYNFHVDRIVLFKDDLSMDGLDVKEESEILNGHDIDMEAPAPVDSITPISIFSNRIILSWPITTDNYELLGYNVFVDSVKMNTNLLVKNEFVITGLTAGNEYAVQIEAVDWVGNASMNSPTLLTTTAADNTPPSKITDLKANSYPQTIELTWNTATDNQYVAGYRLYLNGALNKTVYTNFASITRLIPDKTYLVEVSAIDGSENESEKELIYARTHEPVSIPVPKVTNAPVIDAEMDEVWNQSPFWAIEKIVPVSAVYPEYEDHSARFKMLFDNEYLYILVQVKDNITISNASPLYNADNVEIFLDGNFSHGTAYDNDDIQLRFLIDRDSIQAWPESKSIEGAEYAQKKSDTGYTLEIRLTLQNFNISSADGHKFGFDIHIADNDLGFRKHKLQWHSTQDIGWKNPSVFGAAIINGTAYVPKDPTVSVASIQEDNHLMVYPNPAEDMFSLKLSKGGHVQTIKIFDSMGKLIKETHPVSNEDDIDVSVLRTGIYLLYITTEAGHIYRRKLSKM